MPADKEDAAATQSVVSEQSNPSDLTGNNGNGPPPHSSPMALDTARQWMATLLPLVLVVLAAAVFAVRQEGRIDVMLARLDTVATVQKELRALATRQASTEAALRELAAASRALTEAMAREREIGMSTIRAARDELDGRLQRVERELERMRERSVP